MADILDASNNYINLTDLTTLKSAEDLEVVYTNADRDMILKSLAYTINSAANCGQSEVYWQHELPDDVKSILEGKHYRCAKILTCANPGRLWVISWRKSI